MKTVPIPGGTVSIREAHEIRQRDRKRVVSAGLAAASAMNKIAEQQRTHKELTTLDVGALGLTFEEGESFQTLQKAVIVASVVAWSRPGPIPDWDTVEDLPSGVYKALEKATQDNLGVAMAGVDFEPPAPSSPGFEGSPTVPSADSERGSRAEQESQSIETPSSDGTSTSTVEPSPA
jgi:hypothetical protein